MKARALAGRSPGLIRRLARIASVLAISLPGCALATDLRFTILEEPLVLDRLAGTWLARADFNGDGLDDLLVGGTNQASLAKTELTLLFSNGDGTLAEAPRNYTPRKAKTATPRAASGDFDGNDRVDVIVFGIGSTT